MTGNRVAAIDCGTNSIRLLIAEPASDGGLIAGGLIDVAREMRIVRLGQDVDRTGRLAAPAIERTRLALIEYVTMIRANDVSDIRMVATSATRDAVNRDEFVQMVLGVLGVEPEVITGATEARLSFQGAVAGFGGLPGPLLVADIGGGSTEVVLGDPKGGGASSLRAFSMDIGCVRLTERRLRDDPPTAAQIEAARGDIDEALLAARAHVPIEQTAAFIGVAGTVTTMAAIVLGLTSYSPDAIHGSSMSAGQVSELTERLLGMSHAERAALPVMHPGRVDVIAGGALVLDALMRASGAACVIASEHDILDGIAASIVH